jgi:hypothetical protein
LSSFEPGLIVDVVRRAGVELFKRGAPSGEALIRCPWAGRHRNDDAHPSCRINPEKNTFYCDPCGEGGGVQRFAELLSVDMGSLLGRSRERRASRPSCFAPTGPVSETTQHWFSRSLSKTYTPEAWQRLGVLEGLVGREPAIAFPLPGGGYKVCLYRHPDAKRGKPYSFRFIDGGKAELLLVGEGPEVLLTAGEWDLLAALSAGAACVATGTCGEGTWKRQWSERLAGKRVVIVYDVDPPGRVGAEKVRLSLLSVAHPVVVHLPLSGDSDRDGKDLSDFLALNSFNELRKLMDEPLQDAGLAGSVPPEMAVADQIDAILSAILPARLKRREAATILIDDLKRNGRLRARGDDSSGSNKMRVVSTTSMPSRSGPSWSAAIGSTPPIASSSTSWRRSSPRS